MNPIDPFRGLVAFSITPTHPDETIDFEKTVMHANFLADSGVDAIAFFGSSGGLGSFSAEERMSFTAEVVPEVRKRVPVMLGIGGGPAREVFRLAEMAERHQVDALLVVPFTYWPLTDDELLAYYSSIASVTNTPIAVYNNPQLSGVDIRPEVIRQLAELENIQYLKESSPEPGRITEVKRLVQDRLVVLAGRDDTVLDGILAGADGWASGCANFIPAQCQAILRECRTGMAEPPTLQELLPLMRFCMAESLIRTGHAALDLMGRGVGDPRDPIQPLPPLQRLALESLLRDSHVTGQTPS